MKQIQFINPRVATFETDKSDKLSIYIKTTLKPKPFEKNSNISNTISNTPFILLENGFYLLQEDNTKIKL